MNLRTPCGRTCNGRGFRALQLLEGSASSFQDHRGPGPERGCKEAQVTGDHRSPGPQPSVVDQMAESQWMGASPAHLGSCQLGPRSHRGSQTDCLCQETLPRKWMWSPEAREAWAFHLNPHGWLSPERRTPALCWGGAVCRISPPLRWLGPVKGEPRCSPVPALRRTWNFPCESPLAKEYLSTRCHQRHHLPNRKGGMFVSPKGSCCFLAPSLKER